MGKILLVTGASSDVGGALIRRVAHRYDAVLAHYRSADSAITALQAELGEKIVPLQADFSEEASTVSLAETILARGLTPAHFAHLASSPVRAVATKFGKTSWQTFEDQASVAFRSAVLLCQAFLPAMAKQRAGKVVFMLSSNTVLQPAPKYSAAYMSAKYALLGLMKALSAEYADKGVAVNAVSPSMIDTKFLADVPELIVRRNAEESPLGRNLVTADVAPVFDFLLSDGADCITGQNIAVTAGN